ncbi:MAG: nucleotidyltransferase domain-containing protein [Nanoarchaeota archaeon]
MSKQKEQSKEQKQTKEEYKKDYKSPSGVPAQQTPQMPELPPEVKERLDKIKAKLDKFQKVIVEKFDKYIMGICLLPPPQEKPGMDAEELKKLKDEKDKVHILVLIDDTEPTKMSKQELRDKLFAIIEKEAKEADPNFLPQTLLLTELWQNCYDGKSELLQLIAMSAPVYDTGMVSAIRIAEIHKTMVLKKFEKYIVAYVLAGSLVQGKATKESDIDVFIVIDDTDVKKMTRGELKDKLRQIIIGMGYQAGEMTGVKNKINIQVYILTDFWESVKEAHPVIFTFLRDGVPFYDRGIFMPWKQLLKMGRIKPSPEAIDMYMSTGEQIIDRVKLKIKDIGMEDLFYAILTPSQAALMMHGVAPPTPKETPQVMRDVFVKKEKLLTEEDVKILERNITIRKELEHGTRKELSGKEMDELLEGADKYLKRIRKLFTQIEKIKEEETITHINDTIATVIRDALKLEGLDSIPESDLVHEFEDKIISTGKLPANLLRQIHSVFDAKKAFDSGKMTRTDVEKVRKEASELIKTVVEYIQRKRSQELAKTRLRVKYGEKFGELTLLGDTAFVVKDLDAEERELEKTKLNADGSLGTLEKSNYEELEQALAKVKIPARAFIREKTFESLKKVFGRDVEVMVSV